VEFTQDDSGTATASINYLAERGAVASLKSRVKWGIA
jgi:hypothetical protein